MKDSAKLPLQFDPKSLQMDLRRLEDADWIDHFVKQNYEGSWSVIPLRGPAHASHPVMMIYSDPGCTEFSDTPFLDECPWRLPPARVTPLWDGSAPDAVDSRRVALGFVHEFEAAVNVAAVISPDWFKSLQTSLVK